MQMGHSAEMLRCLETLDVVGIRALWHEIAPGMIQPQSDEEALATLHYARTTTQRLMPKLRYYSHRWLNDHGLPSGLPDHMKQSAERMYPKIESVVGISVNTRSEILRPIMLPIREAMEEAVLESYSDGKKDDIPHIRERMKEARDETIKKLLGSI